MKLDQEAHEAFESAKHHLATIKELVMSPQMIEEKRDHHVRLFRRHVRSFFWELVSTFDTILCWANRRYSLGINECDVDWSSIKAKAKKGAKDQDDWDKKFALLQSTKNSPWFFEVSQYRNFAHRAHLFAVTEYAEKRNGDTVEYEIKATRLEPAREGQYEYLEIVQQLSGYLEEMRGLGEAIFAVKNQMVGSTQNSNA